MKIVPMFLVVLLSTTAAFANPERPDRPRPVPAPVPAPAPAPYPAPAPRPAPPAYPVPAPAPAPVPGNPDGQFRGRVHRLSVMIERDAVEAVRLAKQLFSRGLYDRLTDQEVRAVAELAFVQDTAREFRAAVDAEAYSDNPMRSREAYMWLHRSFSVVERDPVISAQHELRGIRGPVSRMERTIAQLRAFYSLAERVGWTMAEVVLLAEELERDTANLYNLAIREADNRRETHIVQLLDGFRLEAANFAREARLVRAPGSARIVLGESYRRLQHRFAQLDRLMDDPRFARFSPAVKAAYAEVERGYRDLTLAFTGTR